MTGGDVWREGGSGLGKRMMAGGGLREGRPKSGKQGRRCGGDGRRVVLEGDLERMVEMGR